MFDEKTLESLAKSLFGPDAKVKVTRIDSAEGLLNSLKEALKDTLGEFISNDRDTEKEENHDTNNGIEGVDTKVYEPVLSIALKSQDEHIEWGTREGELVVRTWTNDKNRKTRHSVLLEDLYSREQITPVIDREKMVAEFFLDLDEDDDVTFLEEELDGDDVDVDVDFQQCEQPKEQKKVVKNTIKKKSDGAAKK